MLEFILDRYNYWVVIVLMMMGLYIVISRGNLVKKIIGLNVFQTSVFIFYITIGKIAGGTAPIYLYDDYKKRTHHGDEGHGDDKGHGDAAAHAEITPESLHDGLGANSLEAAAAASHGAAPADKIANDVHHTDTSANDILAAPEEPLLEVADPPATDHAVDLGQSALSPEVVDVIYTNPLPHVLILTAIVVGVATTAVGLALAVRIREAYGTIEEDELEADDAIAEYGAEVGAAS